jgi:arsenite-transporting ATPase
LGELNRARVPVTDIVINQLYPQNHCTVCANERSSQARLLRKALASRVFSSYAFWGVPLFPGEMRGAKALEMLWTQTTMVTRETFSVARPITLAFPRVEATVALPSTESTLLIFAGKGGVGKTTLSCATSLRLAEDFPSKEVLLCSTDPAQSLSACLVLPVGLSPKRLCPGLTVLELDAQAEFNALKQLYAQELKAFLHALMPNMNLAFDQEAMEKMLDLSPPGLDEIMALTRVMDLIEHGRYHRLVLDSAPTGHLIRLLEMPELVDQWLKVFFGLFLKYKQIFRLPKVTQHLVAMSKNLKRLRAMLADPSQCAIYGVTILTEMAFEETEDLAAACKRMRVHLSLLFLNLATPPSECPLCSALHQRETVIRHKYQQTFPNTQQVLVYRQGEPRGLSRLGELAQALYGAPVKMCVNYA